jgi:hypothetical protein
MARIMNRRAALGALVALPMVGVPSVALAEPSEKLSELIAAHQEKWKDFVLAMNELEAASPGYHSRFVGIGDREYRLGSGQAEIEKQIEQHFEEEAEVLRRVDQWSPGACAPVLAALERERDAAIARLETVFAPHTAADERYHVASNAESDALMAICEHRCESPEELIRKIRFLKGYEVELMPEQYEAVFDAILPEGESEEA